MATDYLSSNRYGSNRWQGYEIFKLLSDRNGKPFSDGGKYVVFKDGKLICEENTERAANEKYFDGVCDGLSKKDYLGLNEKLR